MKTLIKEMTAGFEYLEGDYNFTTTIEGKEYEVSSTLRGGLAMFAVVYCDDKNIDHDCEIKNALDLLAHEGYLDHQANKEAEKQFDDNGNEIK